MKYINRPYNITEKCKNTSNRTRKLKNLPHRFKEVNV